MRRRATSIAIRIAVIITIAAAAAFTAGMIAGGMTEAAAQQPDTDPGRLSAETVEPEPAETAPEPVEPSMPEETETEPEPAIEPEPEAVPEDEPEPEPVPDPEPTEESEPEAEQQDEPETEVEPDPVPWTDADVEMLAKLMYAEAGGVHDTKQQAAIAWCVLNRLDEGSFGDTIAEVITAPEQFAWHESTQTTDAMRELAEDVLERWWAEKQGEENVGRVLPSCYLYFDGDGVTNHFHVDWQGQYSWGWTLPDPYDN